MAATGRDTHTQSATADREIVISRVISAPRELVFEAFTEVRHLSRWWGPEGFTTTTRAFEFRVGGEWDFVMHGPDGTDYSDRGSQYVLIKYTERLAEAGIEPSVGSVGDSYDNALAETINGLYKAEVIHRRGSWRTIEAVEFATLGMGRLVQQSPAAGAYRQHPAGRSRGTLLRQGGRNRRGGVTQTK